MVIDFEQFYDEIECAVYGALAQYEAALGMECDADARRALTTDGFEHMRGVAKEMWEMFAEDIRDAAREVN